MIRVKQMLVGVLAGISLLSSSYATTASTSPVGYWKTIDNASGKPSSIVYIWKSKDNELKGKVVKVISHSKEKKSPAKLCTACVGAQKNKPLAGMVILSGLKAKESHWGNGRILDPENGKTYNCSMRLAENGKRLNVNGYKGIPLLGRSQTWERVDLMSN